jgi:DNA-binding transcriptional LysR family regulator
MELMQLQMLVAVAEEGTLQRAAERVYRTGPAVSIAIGKLEGELGTPLFDRSGHDFRLTDAGEVFLNYAKRMLSLRDEALAAAEGIKNIKRGHMRIGANQSIGEYLLPRLTEAFLKQYPDVKVKVVIGYSESVISALKHHELDVALVASRPRDSDLQAHLLMRDKLVAAMSPKHHLANTEVIHIQDLGAEPLIVLTVSSELRERVVETFRRFHIPLNVRVETETLESVKQMAARDMGMGIVPRMCVQKEEASGELIVKTIEEFREERNLWIVCRRQAREPSPVCQAFMKLIKSELNPALRPHYANARS